MIVTEQLRRVLFAACGFVRDEEIEPTIAVKIGPSGGLRGMERRSPLPQ